jgi:hypothetical protein
MPFSVKTLNAFEMTGRMAACEIPATRSGHRAFVGIYPPDPTRGILRWRIKRFEIPLHLVGGNFYEPDLADSQIMRAESLEDVENVLHSWAIAPSLFDAPWKCDWPL